MRPVRALVTAAAVALVVSCSGGSSSPKTPAASNGQTPRGEQAGSGIQEKALQAYAALRSGIVHVTGVASQASTSVAFTIDYTTADDRFAYTAQSTFQNVPAEARVIAVPPEAWSFENGAWKPLPAALALDTFRARRIWSLVPFPQASLRGKETVGAVAVAHYHYEGGTQLPLGDLAGSLVASSNVEFQGNLTHVVVDYWVDQQNGWPVKASYHLTGDGDLQITAELTRANDASVTIEPPEPSR